MVMCVKIAQNRAGRQAQVVARVLARRGNTWQGQEISIKMKV